MKGDRRGYILGVVACSFQGHRTKKRCEAKSRYEAGRVHGKEKHGRDGKGARSGGIIKGLERRIKVEILVRPGVPTVVTDPPS